MGVGVVERDEDEPRKEEQAGSVCDRERERDACEVDSGSGGGGDLAPGLEGRLAFLFSLSLPLLPLLSALRVRSAMSELETAYRTLA